MNLSPTEDLCMEVLAARYRLGEPIWTFDVRHHKALKSLAGKGLVTIIHGIVQKTVRASLTAAGIEEYTDPSYSPPKPPEAPSDPLLCLSCYTGWHDRCRKGGCECTHLSEVKR